MEKDFVRNRITELRLKKGVSEYKMSYDLGHSRSYVYNISSGKSLPPMAEFLEICNFFGITPMQFFDETIENPALLQSAIDELKKLDDDDMMLIISNIRRLAKKIDYKNVGFHILKSYVFSNYRFLEFFSPSVFLMG